MTVTCIEVDCDVPTYSRDLCRHHYDKIRRSTGLPDRPCEMDRFLSFVKIDANGCWIWTGYCDRNGYGRFYNTSRRSIDWAHRVSYRLHHGPIPERHEIDHACQVTNCVCPDHLEAVTKAEHVARTYRRLGKDNRHLWAAELRQQGLTYGEIADVIGLAGKTSAQDAIKAAVRKGLVDPDDVPPVRHLSHAERLDVRDLYDFGVPQSVIAQWYDVDDSHVSRICSGKAIA